MCNTEQVIWRLSYDKDWGLRGNRRNVFWYRFWKFYNNLKIVRDGIEQELAGSKNHK